MRWLTGPTGTIRIFVESRNLEQSLRKMPSRQMSREGWRPACNRSVESLKRITVLARVLAHVKTFGLQLLGFIICELPGGR